MKEDRYPAASRENRENRSRKKPADSAAQVRTNRSGMKPLENTTARRQPQRSQLQAETERNAHRNDRYPAAKSNSKSDDLRKAPQQVKKSARPVAKKKKRRSLIYAIFAALKLEIQQTFESLRKSAAEKKKKRESKADEKKQRKAQAAEKKKQPKAPAVEKKRSSRSVVKEKKPQTPVQPAPEEENLPVTEQLEMDDAQLQALLKIHLDEEDLQETEEPSVEEILQIVERPAVEDDLQVAAQPDLEEADFQSQADMDDEQLQALLKHYFEDDALQETEQPAAVDEETSQLSKDARKSVNTDGDTTQMVADYRREAAQKKARREANKPILIQAVLIFCSIMLATLIFLLVRSVISNNDFNKLQKHIQEREAFAATSEPTDSADSNLNSLPAIGNQENTEELLESVPVEKSMLFKYEDLYQENPDLFGWIQIDDTVIDYPVMRSEEDNEKYLYANFEGKYRFTGLPFVDNQCSADSDNLVIYAHNIKDGSMFRSLFKYEKESYWQEHPTIMYSDLYEDYEYEVLAVFYDRVYKKTEDVFKFYQFIDAENEEDFDYAIQQFKSKSLYDTGVDAQYGDKLITLVTCSYQVENGRFVVVARRK